jgi:transglutaminase-like putative cysteine protease
MSTLLKETFYFDYSHPDFQEYILPIKELSKSKQAQSLFNKVRDDFRYDPYHLDLRPDALKASTILKKKKAWCVEKSIVLIAGLRALGFEAKAGYGIVINHIGVEKLLQYLKRPEIVFHGYVSVNYGGKWQKLTPAFDRLVCRASKVDVMQWDGKSDVMFQEFDKSGERFMEYIHYYGEFDDVPIDLMNNEMKKYYPHLFENKYNTDQFSFHHL